MSKEIKRVIKKTITAGGDECKMYLHYHRHQRILVIDKLILCNKEVGEDFLKHCLLTKVKQYKGRYLLRQIFSVRLDTLVEIITDVVDVEHLEVTNCNVK